jgi:hypothetical protein
MELSWALPGEATMPDKQPEIVPVKEAFRAWVTRIKDPDYWWEPLVVTAWLYVIPILVGVYFYFGAGVLIGVIIFLIGFVIVAPLFWIMFVIPIAWLFRRETDRFKTLKALELCDLCTALIEGKDYPLAMSGKRNKQQLKEWELQRMAYFISGKCALGALAEYKEMQDVISSRSFWIHRNGHEARERVKGLVIGSYLALATCGIGYVVFFIGYFVFLN